jgi:hypothetical protein
MEDAAAGAAPVVDHRRPTAVVRGLVGRQRVPVGTSQPVRVQDLEQELVTPVLVKKVVDRKRHPRTTRGTALARRGKSRFTENGS